MYTDCKVTLIYYAIYIYKCPLVVLYLYILYKLYNYQLPTITNCFLCLYYII